MYSFLSNFSNDLDKFSRLKPQQQKKKNVYNTASELYNDLLETYFDVYYDLWDAKRSRMDPQYDPANLTLDEYTIVNGVKKNQVMKKN